MSEQGRQPRPSDEAERLWLLNALLGSPQDAIIAVDLHDRITTWNRGAEQLYGYSAAEVLGEHFEALLVPKDQRKARWDMVQRAREGDIQVFEAQRRHKDGRIIDISLTVQGIQDPNGKVVGGLTVSRSIEARKRAEREREYLLSSLTHDLLQPLAVILLEVRMAAELFRNKRLGRARADRAHETVEANVAAASDIVHEIRDMTLLGLGRQLDLQLDELDLVTLLKDVIGANQEETIRRVLVVNAPSEPLVGRWDRRRLRRAIQNLLANAVKFSPEGSTITVSLSQVIDEHRTYAQLVVADQGVGIPEHDLPHVFERFYRATNTHDVTGTGIGLATVAQVVGQHGGRVRVENQAGAGSRFTMTVPVKPTRRRTVE